MSRLYADKVTLAYDATAVVPELSLRIPDGKITAIVGPNGCGKSTLLRALARLLLPRKGAVLLDGEAIHHQPTKVVAKQIGLLAQQPNAPEAITVADLARRGRYPHQGFMQPFSKEDECAVSRALKLTDMLSFKDHPVDELSGGQRQRAWIAMALAQETPLLLLDEPTTYLDINHQQEILALVKRLNHQGRTALLVLHDINHAAQVSDVVVAMRAGRIMAEGPPEGVLTPQLLRKVFGVACDLVRHPQDGRPFTVPRSRLALDTSESRSEVSAFSTEQLAVGYDGPPVLQDVSVTIPSGCITAVIGANGCGKSTLLRSCARLLKPQAGAVRLCDQSVWLGSHRAFAQRVAVLSQGALAPPSVRVEELVALGRHPHQRWYRRWSRADQAAVDQALTVTGCSELRDRPLETLSGGQRQRVWLAMALAQDTDILLLDEPTTFLDIAHQIEMLDLIRELNREHRRTVVLIVHDLCHACRYADHLIAMHEGKVVAAGPPREVVTEALVREVFAFESCVVRDPLTACPLVLPRLIAPYEEQRHAMMSPYSSDTTVKSPEEVV